MYRSDVATSQFSKLIFNSEQIVHSRGEGKRSYRNIYIISSCGAVPVRTLTLERVSGEVGWHVESADCHLAVAALPRQIFPLPVTRAAPLHQEPRDSSLPSPAITSDARDSYPRSSPLVATHQSPTRRRTNGYSDDEARPSGGAREDEKAPTVGLSQGFPPRGDRNAPHRYVKGSSAGPFYFS